MKISPRFHRAFTLIELLVCILIVTLLCALLFPGMTRMNKSAQASKCVVNLRQIAAMERIFAAENNNRIGSASSTDGAGNIMTWSDWLVGYGGRPAYFSGSTAPQNTSRSDYSVLMCPGQSPLPYKVHSSSIYTTYGMIHSAGAASEIAGYKMEDWVKSDGQYTWHNLTAVPEPSKIPLLADTVVYQGSAAKKQWYYWYPHKIAENGGIHLRHDNRANVLFYDGHVSQLSKDDLARLGIKMAISSDYQPLNLTPPSQ